MDITNRALDLIPWLAGALAVMWAAMAVGIAVEWLRKLRSTSNPPGDRGGAAVPQVVTERADGVGGVGGVGGVR